MTRRQRRLSFSRHRGLLLCLLALMLMHSAVVADEPQKIKQVLVLYSLRTTPPVQGEIDQGLRAALQANGRYPVDIDTEFLDLDRFEEAAYLDELLSLLRRKYAHRRPDVIIPVFHPAVTFLLMYGDAIFPGVPVVFAAELKQFLQNLTLKPNMTGAYAVPEIAANLQLALTLQSQTRQVVVVGGTSGSDRVYQSWVRAGFAPYAEQVEFTYLTDLPLEEIQERLAHLPPQTIIFFLTFNRDSKGREFLSRDVLNLLARAANAPVYGFYDTLLGEGIAGGILISFQEQGRLAGELAGRILNGEKTGQLPPVLASNRPMFDWRQLRRWGIPEEKLPPDSQVLYRAQTLWELYRGWIIGCLVLLGLQSALIGALLINRASRRRAERGLAERLRFEEVLSELSAAFINFSGERADQEIDTCLDRVLKSLKLDRISVLEFSDDEGQFQTRHFSTAPGIPGISRYIPTEAVPWFARNIAKGETLMYAHLPDDLPAEAIQEKEYCRQEGLKSIISLPLKVEGTVLGAINFSTLREHVDWSNYPVTRLNLVAEIFANAILRRRTQQALEDRLGFEELLTELSAAFVNLPAPRVDSEIKGWHSRVADFLKVERSNIQLFSPDKSALLPMSSHTTPGVEPFNQTVIREEFPWYYEQVCQGKILAYSRLPEELPGELTEEREFCLRSGMKSFVCVPLAMGGGVLGTLSMEFHTHYVDWPAYLIRRLGLVGEIFANALMRQRAAASLQEYEQSYRIVADFTYDWEYWENPDGSLRYVSPACERISGYRVEEFLSRPQLFHEIILPEDRKTWEDHQREIRQAPGHHEIQFRLRRPDGDVRWIEHACQPVHGNRGESLGFRASNRDITARKDTERKEQQQREELAHVMRVATLGELTASLAHEFNQPLNAVLNNAQAALRFLNREEPDFAEVEAALQDIARDGKRASAVIQRLRSFLKPGLGHPEAVNINEVVQEAVALVQNELMSRRIATSLDLAPDLPPVQGDRIQLQQVILNLLLNALEAIKQAATAAPEIHLKTGQESPDFITVSLKDNGKGLPAEELERIFEPFWTGKAEGLGLGLSISRSIILAHGGRLWAKANADRGATFLFTLPLYQGESNEPYTDDGLRD
jgi:PAS domain S-box-containing protein